MTSKEKRLSSPQVQRIVHYGREDKVRRSSFHQTDEEAEEGTPRLWPVSLPHSLSFPLGSPAYGSGQVPSDISLSSLGMSSQTHTGTVRFIISQVFLNLFIKLTTEMVHHRWFWARSPTPCSWNFYFPALGLGWLTASMVFGDWIKECYNVWVRDSVMLLISATSGVMVKMFPTTSSFSI